MDVSLLKELRERTHLSMSVCKRVLAQVGNDIDKAVEELQKQNIIKTVDPLVVPAEGMVYAKAIDGVGHVCEINCETDFSARSDLFKSFVDEFVIFDLEKSDMISEYFTKTKRGKLISNQLGEKIVIKRTDSLWTDRATDIDEKFLAGVCRAYNHHNNKIAVLVGATIEKEHAENPRFLNFLDDCAVHIAATNPMFLTTEGSICHPDIKTTKMYSDQKAIFEEQVKDKPENMKERIVSGKFEAWYKETVFLKQESVVHPKKTIQALQYELQKELGFKFAIVDFIRYELGA